MQVEINKPSSVYIRFTEYLPDVFTLYDEYGRLYHYRYLDRVPRIKFNIPDKGKYFSDIPFEVYKIRSIEIPRNIPKLMPPDRGRATGEISIVTNADLSGKTPIIYSSEQRIEIPEGMKNLPPTVQLFLYLHELGHLFYSFEEGCDLYAFVNYVRMGYNRSMAFYSMTDFLHKSQQNTRRIYEMFNHIQQTQKTKL